MEQAPANDLTSEDNLSLQEKVGGDMALQPTDLGSGLGSKLEENVTPQLADLGVEFEARNCVQEENVRSTFLPNKEIKTPKTGMVAENNINFGLDKKRKRPEVSLI